MAVRGENQTGAPDRLTGQVAHTEHIRHLAGRARWCARRMCSRTSQVRQTPRYCTAALVLALGVHTAGAYIGGESGAYLRAPVGATAFALGGANTASPVYLASWWNPAMLATYRSRTAAVGIGVRSLGRMESFGSFSFRIPPRVGMGVSLLYRGDPFIDEFYDERGEPIDADGGAYTTLTLKAGLSYLFNRKWSAGLGLGIFYQSLPTDVSESGMVDNSSVTGIGGFCLALRYEPTDRLALALAIRNLGLSMDWDIQSDDYGYYSTRAADEPPPEIALGCRFEGKLLRKPFIWTSDVIGYVFDGAWERLPHAEVVLHNGFEWQTWEVFYIRLGLGDLSLNSNLLYATPEYFETFTARVTAGFSWHMRQLREGLWLNYGIGSDKAGALFDQALDITMTF